MRPLMFLVLGIALVVAPRTARSEAWHAPVEVRDGVPWVMNPETPRDGAEVVPLEELWRHGGESDDEEDFFGVIVDIETDAEGNAYLLDGQLTEIRVYDPTGTYLRTIGREGEGPGEFRRPAALMFFPDGALGVFQLMGGTVVKLTPEGDPAGTFSLPETEDGARRFLRGGATCGETLVLLARDRRREPGKMILIGSLAAYDQAGREIGRFSSTERVMDFANPVFDERTLGNGPWTSGPDRVAAITTFGTYDIHVWGPDATPIRVIHRDGAPLPRSEAEKEAIRKRFVFRGPRRPEVHVADNYPVVDRLFARPDGGLWVLTSRGARERAEGILATFDVFDPEGRFVRQVSLAGEGDPVEDALHLRNDRLFVVRHFQDASASMWSRGGDADGGEEEDAEPIEVICYRLDAP